MAHQIRGFAVRFMTNINVYQLLALGLALSVLIQQMPGPGGGGA